MKWDMITSAFRRESPDKSSALTDVIAAPTAQAPTLDTTAQEALFIARQPIFNDAEKVCAYQLLIRQAGTLLEAAPTTAEQSARLIVDTLNALGVQTALGNHLGFISMPERTMDSDIIDLLPAQNFVLEFPVNYIGTPEAEERCSQLVKRGYKLARPIRNDDAAMSQYAKASNYVIYDLAQQDLQTIAKLDRSVKAYTLIRLVRNINTRADFDACKAYGFDLYQGNFFAHAESIVSNRMDPSRKRVIEIFNLVMNRADISIIENAFKHDVALCYSLLCYINSVGIGMQYKVSSIRNAIMLLGYDFLWRWLSLLVYAGIDLSAAQRVLLNTAIIRGRLTELLGQHNLTEKEANTLFVVGNFSLLDVLLGIPMVEALKRIHLPEDIANAILHRQGKYAPYLELALCFENNQLEQAKQLCVELNISPTAASRAHLAAIEWAGVLAK